MSLAFAGKPSLLARLTLGVVLSEFGSFLPICSKPEMVVAFSQDPPIFDF
jgi:hypothetical protein